jgi:hypothetical protein
MKGRRHVTFRSVSKFLLVARIFRRFFNLHLYFWSSRQTEARKGSDHRAHYMSVYNYQYCAVTSFRHIAWPLRCNLHINSLSSIHPLAFGLIS